MSNTGPHSEPKEKKMSFNIKFPFLPWPLRRLELHFIFNQIFKTVPHLLLHAHLSNLVLMAFHLLIAKYLYALL